MQGIAGLGSLGHAVFLVFTCFIFIYMLHFHLYKVQYSQGLLPLARSFPQ